MLGIEGRTLERGQRKEGVEFVNLIFVQRSRRLVILSM